MQLRRVNRSGRAWRVLACRITAIVAFIAGFKLVNNAEVPQMADEFRRAFKVMRSLPCDVPLASHPAMYNTADKVARLSKGGPNPFIDPAGYKAELDLVEAMFRAVLAAQQKAAGAH